MLLAMRPEDSRYTAIALPGGAHIDASVACVVLCWPVIDPLGRYQYAHREKGGRLAKQAQEWIHCHNEYWPDEDAMAEGNPTRLLERGEQVRMPPAIYIQGTADVAHPVPDRERFLAAYRKAGGRVELNLFEGVGEAFVTNNPDSPQAQAANERIVEFVHRELD
jgi:acetyl esterase/lipase